MPEQTKTRKNTTVQRTQLVAKFSGEVVNRIVTAMAGGRPPRTSPRPPVLLQGAISAPTKTMFIPFPQTTTELGLDLVAGGALWGGHSGLPLTDLI